METPAELERRDEDDEREDDERRVEGADELRVAPEDRDPVVGDGARHRAEDAERRERHDVVRELEEHGDRGLEEVDERLRALVPDVRGGDAEERREDDDLEDVLPRHRVDRRSRGRGAGASRRAFSASRGPRPWPGASGRGRASRGSRRRGRSRARSSSRPRSRRAPSRPCARRPSRRPSSRSRGRSSRR